MTTTNPAPECACPEGRAALSRRGLLKIAGAAGMVTATTAGGARIAVAATPAPGDVLVVLSLRGGMDGLSVVVPVADKDYAAARPNLAIPASSTHKIDTMFGLHPALKPLFGLWDAGKIAAVQAVGQSNPSRSHFAAMAAMVEADPGSSTRTGWLDRVVGLETSTELFEGVTIGRQTLPASMIGPNPKISMNQLAGVSVKLMGKVVPLNAWQSSINALHTGSEHPELVAPTRSALAAVATATKVPSSTATMRTISETRHSMVAAPPEDASGAYPKGELGTSLRDVARLIKAGSGIRVATIDHGSWDMHAALGKSDAGWLRDNLTTVATALAAFAADLGPLMSKVTVVTLSEFGRRVRENGSGGVDHGQGNVSLVMGGGIRGGKVYGTWPGLSPDALEAGIDLAVTTDYRTMLAEILSVRCGVGSMSTIFPGWSGDALGFAIPT